MKFMKKTKDKADKDLKEKEADEIFSRDGALDIKESNYIIEPSHMICQSLVNGRMSYRGFNPSIERIMKSFSKDTSDFATSKEKTETISDNEMADRYENIVHTMEKKFTKKRSRNSREMQENKGKRHKTN